MTNVPSGSKRPWDGTPEKDLHKRPREESRDWRDVHLRSPRGKPPTDKRDGVDKRRVDYRARGRDRGHKRSRDFSRERDRRDDRDRDRERRHDRDRDRTHYSRREESRRDDTRRHDSPRQQLNGNGVARHDDSEKEEGE